MKKIKVRFNLSRGKNFMKWKVEYPNKTVEYHDPEQVQLILTNAQLRNYKKVAEKIYNGANKSVCAWVLCDSVEIKTTDFKELNDLFDRIKYNPRIKPNWTINEEIADYEFMELIISENNKLYKVN